MDHASIGRNPDGTYYYTHGAFLGYVDLSVVLGEPNRGSDPPMEQASQGAIKRPITSRRMSSIRRV
jgi:hypothetical protein